MRPGFGVDLSAVEVFAAVGFGDLTDHAAGISGGNGPFRDAAVDYTACPDDGVGANRDTGKDHGIGTDPDVVADGDVEAVFIECIAGRGMDGMPGGIDAYIRCELAVVADPDHAGVDNSAVVIGEKVFPDFDAVPVITIKGWIHKSIFGFAEQFLYDSFDPVKIRAVDGVELLRQPPGTLLRFKNLIIGDINQSLFHSFNIFHLNDLCFFHNIKCFHEAGTGSRAVRSRLLLE